MADRLLVASNSSPFSSSSSSGRIFQCPCSLPSLRPRQGMGGVRCQAQKNKKSQSSGGGFGAKTIAKPSKHFLAVQCFFFSNTTIAFFKHM